VCVCVCVRARLCIAVLSAYPYDSVCGKVHVRTVCMRICENVKEVKREVLREGVHEFERILMNLGGGL
jgi:hypothetical protein